MAELALRRIAVKRRRWWRPTDREVLALLTFGVIVGNVSWLALQAFAGRWWTAFFLPVWMLLWAFTLHMRERHRRMARRGVSMPVTPLEWVTIAVQVWIVVAIWVVMP